MEALELSTSEEASEDQDELQLVLVVVAGAAQRLRWRLASFDAAPLRVGSTPDCDWQLSGCGGSKVEVMYIGRSLLVRTAQRSGTVTLNGRPLWDGWVPLELGDELCVAAVRLALLVEEPRVRRVQHSAMVPRQTRPADVLRSRSLRAQRKRVLSVLLIALGAATWAWLFLHLD